MERIKIEQLIADESFVNYCLSAEEDDVLFWNEWAEQNEENQLLLQEAKKMVLLLKDQPSQIEFESERERLKRFIERDSKNSKLSLVYPKPIIGIAAAVLLLISIGLYTYKFYTEPINDEIDSVTWVTQEAPAQKVMSITLADGTHVKLSPSSKFSYPKVFSDTLRKVKLDGAAYFDVHKQANKPFVISADDMEVKVLGTTFNLEAFDEDNHIRLALFSGKVAVSAKGIYKEIKPGTRLNYNKEDGTIALAFFDINQKPQMPIHSLDFTHATYKELVQKISRHYGVVFSTSATIKMDFSGRFYDESLEDILSSLTYTTDYRFVVKADTVFVTKK